MAHPGLLQLLVPVEHLLFLPAAGVLPKLVHQPPSIDPLQDLSFVVVSVGDRGGVRALDAAPELLEGSVGLVPPQDRVHLPHGSAQLLIGHAAVFLFLAPELSHGFRAQELEDALAPVLPLHEPLVQLGVDQDVPDELPQVGTSWG